METSQIAIVEFESIVSKSLAVSVRDSCLAPWRGSTSGTMRSTMSGRFRPTMVSLPLSGSNNVKTDDAIAEVFVLFKVTAIAMLGLQNLRGQRSRKEGKEAARMAVTLTHGHGQTQRLLRHRSSKQSRLTQRELRDRSLPSTKGRNALTTDVDSLRRTKGTI